MCSHAFATPGQPEVENAFRAGCEVAKKGGAIAAEAVRSSLLETDLLKSLVQLAKNVPLV
jgi:hypothetical protein